MFILTIKFSLKIKRLECVIKLSASLQKGESLDYNSSSSTPNVRCYLHVDQDFEK